MNRRRILPLLLVGVGLVVGLFLDRTISRSTNAEQATTNLSDRWEYLVIASVNWDSERKIYYARICHFRSSGCQESDIEGPPLGDNNSGTQGMLMTLAKASASLGQAGWEMVGEFAPVGDQAPRRLYFKRRLK
jgi:hypothetical protein